jgi:predicted phosphodiesterase
LSDLHYRDPASSLQNQEAFAPLLEGADKIIFNGDTLDTQIPALRSHADELLAFFAQAAPSATYLSGNHDPDISYHAELSLCDERVWLTHGDVFFDEIAPWSHHRPEFRRRLATLSQGMPPERLARIETRLQLNRLACQKLPEPPHLFQASLPARSRRLLRTLFPPTRILAMLEAWRTTPLKAASLARAQRPKARVVVFGHTHFPGVWKLRGTPEVTVINTGSFTRPFDGQFVDLQGDHVRVRRIARSRGKFRPDRVVADFSLAKS